MKAVTKRALSAGRQQHGLDPMRYPSVQGTVERMAKDAFKPTRLFGDIVDVMTAIAKKK